MLQQLDVIFSKATGSVAQVLRAWVKPNASPMVRNLCDKGTVSGILQKWLDVEQFHGDRHLKRKK